jgi:hypothetical protein
MQPNKLTGLENKGKVFFKEYFLRHFSKIKSHEEVTKQ